MALSLPPEEPRPGAPLWMVTFADLMSLLLGFFILLVSASTVEVKKFETAADSIRNAFGSAAPAGTTRDALERELPDPGNSAASKETLDDPESRLVVARLRAALEKTGMIDRASVDVSPRGVALRVPDRGLFESGEVDLRGEALELVRELTRVAANTPGSIEVEGHTDNVPIASSRFPSNWELSAARAGAAVRFLTAEGIPAHRLKAVGYADTRPLVPNDSAEARAANRRIEVLFVHMTEAAATAMEGIPR